MGVKPQLLCDLVLDESSNGRDSSTIPLTRRLLARVGDSSMWYGFVVTSAPKPVLETGVNSNVTIAFLDEPGARDALNFDETIYFGNGIKTQGTIKLKNWLDS